jgi:CubicO group peptidase (beta-lactamase class C family)
MHPPEISMTKRRLILILATAVTGVLLLGVARARDVPKVATGFVANILCSETFVSGLDPEKTFAETTDAMPGTSLITWAMNIRIDRARRDVTVTLLGLGRSHAVYRNGAGCYLDHGGIAAEIAIPSANDEPALLPDIAGPPVVQPANPQLAAALDRAFAEPEQPPFRRTRAIVVMKNGRVIAERYADGIGVDTPLLGFSVTKSVTSTLVGILVREGKLAVDTPAPVAAWRDPKDPRHAITIDQLLRQTAGIGLGSSLEASLASVFEPVNRMKFMEPDMAGYAESIALATPPGTAWSYHDGNYLILSQIVQHAAGGHPADYLRFAHDELFAPLGMRHVTIEFDASGTPEGAGAMLASARDWAQFGQLYLNDGVVGGKRILPEGWVKYSAEPTPGGFVGYGAGFWTNLGDSRGAKYRIGEGWPRDAIIAKGTVGQYVIIVPSQQLVIARFGRTVNFPLDADGVSQLVRDVVAATAGKEKLANTN